MKYQQLTGLNTAQSLPSRPNGARSVVLQPEVQNVRIRDDGTDPTASVGVLLVAGGIYTFRGDLAALRAIETTPSATLNVWFQGD